MNPILCPLRNGLALTKAALVSFLVQDIGDVSVLFCDNASSDGTGQWLASLRDPRVSVMSNVQPMSVAQSWNAMLRWTFKQGAEYALVVNNDVVLRPDTYRHLVSDGGMFVSAVGCDDPKCVEPPYDDPVPQLKRPNPDYSCYLIMRECWERVPFDEDCDIGFFEDNIHHVALHQAGIKAWCIGVPFYHVGSGTVKNSSLLDLRSIRKAADRNREYFFSKYRCYPGTSEYESLFTEAAV